MKKVVCVIAALCIGFAASAQVIVGGNLGFGVSNSNNKTTNILGSTTTELTMDGPNSFNFEFMPKIGYQFKNKMSVGVVGGYLMNQSRVISVTPPDGSGWLNYNSETITTSSSWQVTPYWRSVAASYGDLTFFVELSVPFVWNNPDKIHTDVEYTLDGTKHDLENSIDGPIKSFSWGISLVPGFNYAMNEHCSMDLYVDVLSIAYNRTKTTNYTEGDGWSNEILTYQNDFKIGIRSLPSSTLFRIGFNYAF